MSENKYSGYNNYIDSSLLGCAEPGHIIKNKLVILRKSKDCKK
jgi:hypothetical protein